MKTIDAAFLSRLGLSLAGAAQLHGIRVDTVKNWSVGRRTVPAGAWDELRAYEAQIVDRAEAMRELWEENPSDLEIVAKEADHYSLMAAADFILGLPEGSHVFESGTETNALADRKSVVRGKGVSVRDALCGVRT